MPATTISPPYVALHAFLNAKGTPEVSLTFEEIEEIVGCALPTAARLHKEWWTHGESGDAPQLRAWTLAGRKAHADLFARSVCFERRPARLR